MDIARVRKKLKTRKKEKGKPEKRREARPRKGASELSAAENLPVSPADPGPDAAAPPVEPLGTALAEAGEPATGTGGEMPPPAGESGVREVEDGEEKPEELHEFLGFKLADEDYAFRVAVVEEILSPHSITRVPSTDPFVLGITSVRGKIIPVVDIKGRLTGVETGELGDKLKIVIIRGPKGSIGVLVGKVMEFITLPGSYLADPPAHLEEPAAEYVDSVASFRDRFVSIVDSEKLFDFKVALEAQ
jgi:purine-binding chemotaxis protein CheW